MRNRLLVWVVCSLGCLIGASDSGAGELAYSIGAGRIEGAGDASGLASFGVSKLAVEHIEVTADVAYMHRTGGRVGNPCVGPIPCPTSDLENSFIPVSLGLIGYLRGPQQSGPYAEFSPSLVVNRWSMEGGAGSGKFTALTAGLKFGLGARLAINENGQIDLGVLYLLSGSVDIEDESIRALTGEERFGGLREAVPFARLSISL
ncbi:MAG TPA: hypothetical protein VFQ05_06355 [Candidatus Eisenbacteria bacterium]|nr:hypothetical protein [Candidatus Eisenbacteria bacterium]